MKVIWAKPIFKNNPARVLVIDVAMDLTSRTVYVLVKGTKSQLLAIRWRRRWRWMVI
jgi:hypothetical protein